jgi:3-oxoacyl-[acyl-carrier-protein] synthase II
MERVVVTGLGVASPLGCTVEAFWAGLLAGESGVVALSGPEFSGLRTRIGAKLAGFSEKEHFDSKEVRRMSRSSLMALLAADQAVDQARLVQDGVDPREVGVVIGSAIGGYAARGVSFWVGRGGPPPPATRSLRPTMSAAAPARTLSQFL